MIALFLGLGLAWAAEVRVGLFVGNNEGDPTEQRLLYAGDDAEKMRDLFVGWGQMSPRDATLLVDDTRRNVQNAFLQVQRRVEEVQAGGDSVTFVFYYSGHGDENSLHLGTSAVEHEQLRTWVEETGAEVRIAFLDACKSGSVIRQKGGSRGGTFDLDVSAEQTRGTAILTSSASSEFSQESRDVGGGFFTYYLHSGLLGAADRNRDGEVSLTEAYAYVHAETAFGTRDTPGTQTPSFDFDLVGAGDLVLTTLEEANAALSFLGGLEGTYAIWDEGRKRYVAELQGADATRIAVRPGTYYVHHKLPGWVEEARYTLRRGETLSVLQEDFVSVSYEDTAAKGHLDRQYRRATLPDLALRGVAGVRGFGNSVAAVEYLPTHAVLGLETRFFTRKGPYFSFDLLSGAGPGEVTIPQGGTRSVLVSSTSLGAVAGWATRPSLFRVGAGGRAEVIGFSRSFPDDARIDAQGAVTVAVGVNTWGGLHYGRFSVDLQFNWMLPGMSFDDNGMHTYGELILASGYRF